MNQDIRVDKSTSIEIDLVMEIRLIKSIRSLFSGTDSRIFLSPKKLLVPPFIFIIQLQSSVSITA